MTPHFPWPTYDSDPDLQIVTVQVDGTASPHLDREHHRLDLSRGGIWHSVTLSTNLREPGPLREGLAADGAYLLVSSPGTNLRFPSRLEPSGDGSFAGGVTLYREQVAGFVSLTAEIVADTHGGRRQVGTSRPWAIVVDKSERPVAPGAPPFAMTWVEFGADGSPQAVRAHPGAYSMLDLSGSEPVLYLNAGVKGLKSLLSAEHPKLEKLRLRELVATRIARDATAAVLRSAAVEIATGDQPGPPDGRLHRQVCEAVGGAMTTVAGPDELYERIWTAEDQGGAVHANLWRDLDAAIDDLTGVNQAVADAVEKVIYG